MAVFNLIDDGAIASRENRNYQRATGPVYRASFSTGGYRRLTPRFLPVSREGGGGWSGDRPPTDFYFRLEHVS
jgi:hypothetical protein